MEMAFENNLKKDKVADTLAEFLRSPKQGRYISTLKYREAVG
jgi:hypothetical protein